MTNDDYEFLAGSGLHCVLEPTEDVGGVSSCHVDGFILPLKPSMGAYSLPSHHLNGTGHGSETDPTYEYSSKQH